MQILFFFLLKTKSQCVLHLYWFVLDVSAKQVCFCRLRFTKKNLNDPVFYCSIIKLRRWVIFVRLVFICDITVCIYFCFKPLLSQLFSVYFRVWLRIDMVWKFQTSAKDIILPDVLHFMCICWTMFSYFSSKNNAPSPFWNIANWWVGIIFLILW